MLHSENWLFIRLAAVVQTVPLSDFLLSQRGVWLDALS